MIRAYHFLSDDMRAEEDIIAGQDEPWHRGELRTFVPMKLDDGDGGLISVSGYHSSPTLWDAMMQADGSIACAVEISDPISTDGDIQQGFSQTSILRKLIAATDLTAELRLFACACAQRVLVIFETSYPRDDRPRRAISTALDYAQHRATADDLKNALTIACDAAERAAGQARIAALSAFGTTFSDPHDAAMTAMRNAAWAVDGRGTPASGTERAWQREYFNSQFAHIFE
jgi:hypothetical protein